MKNYLRKRDQLADAPGLTYKGEETYGTTLGGFCSLCASVFVFFYLFIVLMNFFMSPNYESDT